jgi:hypothetical protein
MSKYIAILLLMLSGFALGISSTAKASQIGSITGDYLDNFGIVIKLVQKGTKLTGWINSGRNEAEAVIIKGVKTNGKITLSLDPDYGINGKGELRISEDGTRLIGRVKKSGYPSGWTSWELSKLGQDGIVLAKPSAIDKEKIREGEKKRQAEIARLGTERKRKAEIARLEAEKKQLNKIIPVASGSGFAVSSVGHVVTNNHVIDGCAYVKIHHKGKAIRSTVIYRDALNDLAVLKGDFVPSAVFKISRRNPEIMQEIFVAGYPFGDRISSSVKVTKGIISALSGIGNNISNIQIDAALQPGNSGGPIFDGKGNLVGVAVAKLDLKLVVENWGVVPEGTNFGIKSNVVVNLLESNGINIQEAGSASLSNADLGKMMSGATYHLSCWMTMAQVRERATSKVMFNDLTN